MATDISAQWRELAVS